MEEEEPLNEEIRDKILRFVRDFIISKNMTVRDAFEIKTLSSDVLIQPYFIKRKLKFICGNDVTYKDIDVLIRKLMSIRAKKQKLASVVGIELGEIGHIRTPYTAKIHELNTRKYKTVETIYEEGEMIEMFNFKEFETLLK